MIYPDTSFEELARAGLPTLKSRISNIECEKPLLNEEWGGYPNKTLFTEIEDGKSEYTCINCVFYFA